MQSIDLLSVHGYNFVNFREIHVEMLLIISLLGVSVTLEKVLSVPTPSPDSEDMNFYLYLL